MEKFSKFNDPFTGINPFIAPRPRPISAKMVVLAILNCPIYILYCLGLPVLGLLISIRRKDGVQPKGLIYCNSVAEFDRSIVGHVFKIGLFGHFKHRTCVVFPENASTNNRAVLRYQNRDDCEYVIGLKYSDNCIYMYGSRLLWLIRFLGACRHVTVTVLKGSGLDRAASVPMVGLDSDDKKRFMSMV